jgi:hypothetical protein
MQVLQEQKPAFPAFAVANVHAVLFQIDVANLEIKGLSQAQAQECDCTRLEKESFKSATVSRSGQRSKYAAMRRTARA